VRGYWDLPEDTARAISDGWLRTGDVGRIDAEGFVFIVDRAKDVVIRGGENVYSVEVEDAIFTHSAVADCAVLGIPHRDLGEEVAAVVVLRPGSKVAAEELAEHVRARLAAFMVPTRWWFRIGPLPRNPAGKILKRALRDEVCGTASSEPQAWNGDPAVWGA
jgi:long-chain acyl-CoA synthetase